jgi:hypothetical protein
MFKLSLRIEEICAVFFYLFFIVYCMWKSSYQEVMVGVPLTSPNLLVCPKLGPGFSTSCRGLFCVQQVKKRGDC